VAFCAVRGGVLTVTGGREVAVACRQAQLGYRLEDLGAQIAAARAAETDADRRARVAQTKLHAHAVRQLMRYLVPGNRGLDDLFADGTR
jgi:F-type H+-transporting ATPase subunit epsilon